MSTSHDFDSAQRGYHLQQKWAKSLTIENVSPPSVAEKVNRIFIQKSSMLHKHFLQKKNSMKASQRSKTGKCFKFFFSWFAKSQGVDIKYKDKYNDVFTQWRISTSMLF